MSSYKQLRDHLSDTAFSILAGKQLFDAVKQEQGQLWNAFKKTQYIIEKRQYKNLQTHQQLRLNAQRYANSYKMLLQNKHFKKIFKDVDMLVEQLGFTLSTQAFLVTIQLIGNKQQVDYWRHLVYQGKIIGAYGQTELGHGSNVQSLETQAHYNDKNGTFIINSPKVTSAKYWPGLLGSYSTHSVIQANTFVKGKSIGVQTFVLEFRDGKLQPLPGIEAGDIGAKLGFKRVDNGYLKINNVEIPRENMLMKYIKVERDGTVLGLQNKQSIKYAYGSMLNLRVRLTNGFSLGVALKSTIELYWLLYKLGPQKVQENKRNIVEGLCCGLGYALANNHTKTLFNNFIREAQSQNYKKADNWLNMCHIVSSTFKALSGWKAISIATRNLTITRNCSFNVTNLPYNFVQVIPAATYQGDNSVLLQQTAKYMIMKESNSSKGQLRRPASQVNPSDIEGSFKVVEYVVAMEVKRIKQLFLKQGQSGVPFNTFWNEKYQKEIIEAAKIWGVKTFLNGVLIFLKDIKEHKQFYHKIAKVFTAVLLNDVPHLSFYGFNVLSSNDWNSFTDNQFKAIIEIGHLVKRDEKTVQQLKQIQLTQRNKQWMNARL